MQFVAQAIDDLSVYPENYALMSRLSFAMTLQQPPGLASLTLIENLFFLEAQVGDARCLAHGGCRGKSFLLNVLLNSTHGFPVGTRPEPETLGVWMRIIPPAILRAPDGSRVVLIDTEGFYGAMASRSYDAKVFAVACLLSSNLVYNTLRTLGTSLFRLLHLSEMVCL